MSRVVTFEEFCRDHLVTQAERRKLVLHLATLRAARTIEVLGLGDFSG